MSLTNLGPGGLLLSANASSAELFCSFTGNRNPPWPGLLEFRATRKKTPVTKRGAKER